MKLWKLIETYNLKSCMNCKTDSEYFLVLPKVSPLHYRVYSGKGAKTVLGCHVEGYPEPQVSNSFHYQPCIYITFITETKQLVSLIDL